MSLGDEACELAVRAGLEPDRWQRDAVDILLAVRDDGMWVCKTYAELVARQNGKGSILEIRALAGLMLLGERRILWSAHEYKTAMEGHERLWALFLELGTSLNELNTLIDVDGVTIQVTTTNGKEAFTRLDTLAKIKFVARSKGSGRGFSADLIIVDEAYAYTPQQQAALLPTKGARPNAQVIYTSSPPLTGDGPAGAILFLLRSRAAAMLSGTPDRLGYREWGLEGDLSALDEIDLDSRANWAQANPAYPGRVTEETIEDFRLEMPDLEFAREILGVWPREIKNGRARAIDRVAWGALLDTSVRRAGAVSLGVEIELDRTWSAIAMHGPGSVDELTTEVDGVPDLARLIAHEPGVDWVVPRLVAVRDRLGEDLVAVGMGSGTYRSLRASLERAGFEVPEDPETPERGHVWVLGGADVAAACGATVDAIAARSFRHHGQRALDAAAGVAQLRIGQDSARWARTGADGDETQTTPLTAWSVALHTHDSRADLVDGGVEPWAFLG